MRLRFGFATVNKNVKRVFQDRFCQVIPNSLLSSLISVFFFLLFLLRPLFCGLSLVPPNPYFSRAPFFCSNISLAAWYGSLVNSALLSALLRLYRPFLPKTLARPPIPSPN